MRFRELSINVALAAASVLVVAGIVEGGTRVLDYISPGPARSWDEFRLRKPPPYRDAPYDVATLIREAIGVRWRTSPDFGWLPEDQSGVYINVVNHERSVVPTAANPSRRLWVFGGSTTIGTEVPDGDTIPSFLQRALAGIEVRNLGATTVSARHQLYRLKTMTPVEPGDIVVFYDGVNDVIQSLYYRDPTGNMIDANRRAIASLNWIQRLVWRIHNKMKDISAFVRRFLTPAAPVGHAIDITDDMVRDLEERYFSILTEADAFVRSRSATFVHFLQPTIYTLAGQSDYERSLLTNGWLVTPNMGDVYAVGYPALRRAAQRAAALGVISIDVTSALDSRRREVFLDFCHITEHGNELVAAALLASLKPLLPPASGPGPAN